MSFLSVQQVSKSYRNGEETTLVLKDLDLEMEKGEMVMIMGPSGSGKTTLMNSLGGIEMPDRGTISLDGTAVTSLDPKELNRYRREMVGMVFQFYNLIPTLTAQENVMLALEGRKLPRREVRERAQRQLELVGLKGKADRFPQELSAGEQQRVALARALVKEPALVLADEPTGNLDEASEAMVLDLLLKARKELGTTFVVVSHNPRLRGHMDRCYELRHGRLSAI
ncbi:MAG TPA: ABC transporter ATP-binding protein [Methanomassiliicoccales archaeon]|nr:ABC transporter ATP-binding protein [Methanomassiliicoccales archaeon]